ncbi:MAG: mechanosensitive ion channel, partial [Romboutsia sp.]|nr:mechanosensitive ion channel [Romboutsia sp.]
YIANRLINLFRKTIFKSSNDVLIANFVAQAIKLFIVLIFILFALNIAGFGKVASGLFAAAGAGAVILGFAFKDIGQNFIAGVILSFNRPFKLDDTVKIGDVFGKVKNMELRFTQIKSFEGIDIYIPNIEIINKPVANYTEDGYYRLDIIFSFPIDIKAKETETLILNTIRKNPNVFEDGVHEIFAVINHITTDVYSIKVYFWIKTKEYRRHYHIIESDIIESVRLILSEHNILLLEALK